MKLCFIVHKRKRPLELIENIHNLHNENKKNHNDASSNSCSVYETEVSKKSDSSIKANLAKTKFINKASAEPKKSVSISASKKNDIIIWV